MTLKIISLVVSRFSPIRVLPNYVNVLLYAEKLGICDKLRYMKETEIPCVIPFENYHHYVQV